jgi:hypothetical protein
MRGTPVFSARANPAHTRLAVFCRSIWFRHKSPASGRPAPFSLLGSLNHPASIWLSGSLCVRTAPSLFMGSLFLDGHPSARFRLAHLFRCHHRFVARSSYPLPVAWTPAPLYIPVAHRCQRLARILRDHSETKARSLPGGTLKLCRLAVVARCPYPARLVRASWRAHSVRCAPLSGNDNPRVSVLHSSYTSPLAVDDTTVRYRIASPRP